MRSVEDETDAAAAAALEQENAAELAEFTMEPAARVSLHAGREVGGGLEKGKQLGGKRTPCLYWPYSLCLVHIFSGKLAHHFLSPLMLLSTELCLSPQCTCLVAELWCRPDCLLNTEGQSWKGGGGGGGGWRTEGPGVSCTAVFRYVARLGCQTFKL